MRLFRDGTVVQARATRLYRAGAKSKFAAFGCDVNSSSELEARTWLGPPNGCERLRNALAGA
jgi:hypothetical protein